jgi:superfamily II DNA or RNA helicase
VSEEIPENAVRRLASHFDAATVAAALVHLRAGQVHVVKPPPWPVVARVHDREGHVVTVAFGAAGHLSSECSCAVGEGCSHAAAAALAVFAREGEYAARQAEAARQAIVGDWLAELGRQDAHPTVALGHEQLVAYVLDVRDGDPALTVVQCARQKRGGLSTGVPIAALADPMRGAPRWVEVDDLRRIAMLRAVTRALPQVTRLPVGRLHTELLRELAGTGLLFWESTRGRPLAYGRPVKEQLTWRPVAGAPGAYRLGADEALVIVAARDPHYVDPGGALIGPLELGVPAELVQRLVTGPPVPASMRTTVERSLRPLLAPAGGTDAADAADAAAAPTPMQPRLFAALADDEPGLRLVAEAAYDDECFPLAEWDAARPFERDLVAEGRAHGRLRTLLAELPHGGKPSTSMELLADARAVAEQLVPRLRHEGWQVTLADDFPHDAPLANVTWVERLRPLSESHGWFALELGVLVAGRTVPLLPILLEAISGGQLVLAPDGSPGHRGAGFNLRLPEGELVYVPAERVHRWLAPLVELELAGLDAGGELKLPAFVAARLGDDRGAPGRFAAPVELEAARARLTALHELAPRAEPPGFVGTLRPYQRLGQAWLRFLHDAGYGGLLADEMGLGKTIQVLAFLEGLRGEGQLGEPGAASSPALVVAPRSLVGNWEREAARFTPRLVTRVHLGAGRAEDAAGLRGVPLVITSYQTLVRDLEAFGQIAWTTVVFDEAQALKNPDTQVRGVARTLRAQSRFCSTGTPLENHLGELWSELDIAMPGLVGRRRSFDAFFRRPVEKHGKTEPLELLRQRIRPFLLRRTKETVELDLPPRTEIVESVELDTPQRDLYETLRLRLDTKVRAALAAKGIAGASMLILDALLKLRQCCCDPRLLRLAEARKVPGSAKLERLLDMLVELADSGRTTLVFSQFTGMLALIKPACAAAGIATLELTGQTRDRDDVVRRFQAGEAPVFLVSLKAGGVGLNLTRADTVIHYDPWWNPAAEAQAVARAHRIGQDRPVMVYKLVARGTIEEAIGKMQDEKRVLTDAALREGGMTHLQPADLETLYRSIV